jgi:hypothetical protein
MFSNVFTEPDNGILRDRLSRLIEGLRLLELPTREDYLAEVYSRVNSIIAIDGEMQPLTSPIPNGPAIVGDVTVNCTRLNEDALDLSNETSRLEDSLSRVYNLAAATQNTLRQQIRELLLSPNSKIYRENFLNKNNISSTTATIDFNAGACMMSLQSEVDIVSTIVISPNSVGSSSDDLSNLTDNNPETIFTWDGTVLELILSFGSVQILNRLTIELDIHDGIELTAFTTSPDGILTEDVLQDLGKSLIVLDATSGKYSGDVIIDFPPRHCSNLKIRLEDRVGDSTLPIRGLAVKSRKYGQSAQITSNPISLPINNVRLVVDQLVPKDLCNITHQLSYDGVQFQAITPNVITNIATAPYWYRAVLEKSNSAFTQAQDPLVNTGLDPKFSANYTIASSNSLPLGNGIMERIITFNNVTGPITFRDSPLGGTIQVQQGAVILSQGPDYTFASQILSFPTPPGTIIVSYQTSIRGAASIKERFDYYTPILYEARFERV